MPTDTVFACGVLPDITGDGRPDVVAGTQDTDNSILVHVLDGASGMIFVDGFESGDTSAWSATVP